MLGVKSNREPIRESFADKVSEQIMVEKYPEIDIVSMTDDTVTFMKKDFEEVLQDLNKLMRENKDNPGVSDNVKQWWKGKHDILSDIVSLWTPLSLL